ncbi:VanZ family protein [Rubritalea marina]|uniref:VanZ family protein n=1 Tax=Rubritalea marina TaxID=361055 RepID=UPI00037A0278|nr:VanZ family protein [Rubritalea marina]
MLKLCTKLMAKPALWLIAWIIWFATLWILSSAPDMDQLPPIPMRDKILHFGYFFLGAGLLYVVLHHLMQRRTTALKVALCTAIGIATGVIDEFHQSFVPGRCGNDLGDITADTLGSLIGALIMAKIVNRLLPSVPA